MMISEKEIHNKKSLLLEKILKDILLNITVVNTTVICLDNDYMLRILPFSHLPVFYYTLCH